MDFKIEFFGDESLSSRIVIDNDLAKKLLTSSNFTTDRKRKFTK
ncbi:hypothetical protein ACUW9N_002001 [Staphylococcus auricularis]|nr:Uncharacterised protein [Staphylococcus auricularis]